MKPDVAGVYTLHVVVRDSCFETFKMLHQVRDTYLKDMLMLACIILFVLQSKHLNFVSNNADEPMNQLIW